MEIVRVYLDARASIRKIEKNMKEKNPHEVYMSRKELYENMGLYEEWMQESILSVGVFKEIAQVFPLMKIEANAMLKRASNFLRGGFHTK